MKLWIGILISYALVFAALFLIDITKPEAKQQPRQFIMEFHQLEPGMHIEIWKQLDSNKRYIIFKTEDGIAVEKY